MSNSLSLPSSNGQNEELDLLSQNQFYCNQSKASIDFTNYTYSTLLYSVSFQRTIFLPSRTLTMSTPLPTTTVTGSPPPALTPVDANSPPALTPADSNSPTEPSPPAAKPADANGGPSPTAANVGPSRGKSATTSLRSERIKERAAELEEWKKGEEEARLTTDAQKKLWKTAEDIGTKFEEENKNNQSSDPIVDAILEESEKRFSKGNIKADERKALKREFDALKFSQIHSAKRMKYMGKFHSKAIDLWKLRHQLVMEELEDLKKENSTLKAANQSLFTAKHKEADEIKKKDGDLQIQALGQVAKKYADKQKVGAALFHKYGFVISKKILSKKPQDIIAAKDFGPNSSKGGRPFFNGLFWELSKSPAASKMEDLCEVNNHELVYNSTLDKAIAEDKSNILSGHFLDTLENRKLIWFGNSALGITGIASQIIKGFNGKRSDESSKKLRPALQAIVFGGIPISAVERTPRQSEILSKVQSVIKSPRGNNKMDESVLKPLYEVLSLQMNPDLKADRVKLFVSEDRQECYGTSTDRNNPIVGLSYKGKAKLHTCNLADCLTVAQEAWVILHLARCYYFHFEETVKIENCPVTPQSLTPKAGTSQSYNQKDVDYFRCIYKIIDEARKEEKAAEQKGTLKKPLSYCFFYYPEEQARLNEERNNQVLEIPAAEENNTGAEEVDVADIDDDSVGGDVVEYL
jgi:hypothetical protein